MSRPSQFVACTTKVVEVSGGNHDKMCPIEYLVSGCQVSGYMAQQNLKKKFPKAFYLDVD